MLNEEQQIELAAKLLKISLEDAIAYHSRISEGSLVYVSVPEKGGESIIVGNTGEVLYANSSIGFTRHLEEYRKGTRTPVNAFDAE